MYSHPTSTTNQIYHFDYNTHSCIITRYIQPQANEFQVVHNDYRVGEHPLVRVALHPPLEGRLQLGATIAGTLDFRFSQEAAQQSSAAPKCVQVVVMLESEEVVEDRWQAPSKRQAGPVRKVCLPLAHSLSSCSSCSCSVKLLSSCMLWCMLWVMLWCMLCYGARYGA